MDELFLVASEEGHARFRSPRVPGEPAAPAGGPMTARISRRSIVHPSPSGGGGGGGGGEGSGRGGLWADDRGGGASLCAGGGCGGGLALRGGVGGVGGGWPNTSRSLEVEIMATRREPDAAGVAFVGVSVARSYR